LLVVLAALIAVVNLVDEARGAHLLPAAHTPVYLVAFAALGLTGILALVSGSQG
jgi:K+ transporter